MKKFFSVATAAAAVLSTAFAAQAADLGRRPPPVAPVYAPAFTWTGFYVGGNIGWGWVNADVTGNWGGGVWGLNSNNFIGGAQVGYNYQMGNFVIGIEYDFDWASGDKSTPFVGTAIGPLQASVDNSWVMTLAGRLGWAMDRWLLYTKLGGGWTRTNVSLVTPAALTIANGHATNAGWLIGVGVEYAFTPNWTAKLEYNYLGLNDKAFATTIAPNVITYSPDVSLLKLGINYKF
jgi:outer membrane immunogenic protein